MGLASVNVAIPALAEELSATASEVGWLPTLYMLGSVAFMLPCGKLADIVGRKKIYTLGLVVNALAALCCSVAGSIESVLVWRFVQGIAAAMIFGTGIAIVTSVTPVEKRGKALGIVASCVYVGLTAAPAVGGFLTEALSWRAVFYFQLPLILMLVVFITLKLKGEWKGDSQTKFDGLGALLFMAFAGFLVYGLAQLPQLTGWLCCVAALSMLALFIQHQKHREQPLIRVALFKESRVFSLSLSSAFFMYASNFAIVFLLSLYLQYIKGLTPSEAGAILLVQALCMAIVAPMAGSLSDRFQPRVVATIGCVLVLAGFTLLNMVSAQSSNTQIMLALCTIGIGFGLFSTPNNTAIMSAVKPSETGVASASMNLARTIGNLVGMSLVNFLLHSQLGDIALEQAEDHVLMQTISSALTMSLVFVLVGTIMSVSRGRQIKQG